MKPTTTILSLLVALLSGILVAGFFADTDDTIASERIKKDSIEQIRQMSAKVAAADRRAGDSENKAKAATEKLDNYKNSVAGLEAANGEIAKNKTKIAELEKALVDSAARIAELTNDLGRARDGTELQVQTEKATKLEAELETVSATAREATKANEALLDENIRLKSKTNLFENPSSPDHRAL